MFAWFRESRRRRYLTEPFPAAWEELLRRHVKHSERLPVDLSVRWRQRVQVFVNSTTWEGCRSFAITDEVKVVVAANATLLTLGMDDDWLNRVRHVLVHPTPYQGQRARIGVAGIDYSQGDWMQQLDDDLEDEHLGELFDNGTVILVWSEVPTAEHITPLGQNVVLHEFAHVFHELRAAWFPTALADNGEPWLDNFQQEFARQVRDANKGRRTLLDDYAAENPEEFFCVATECFFERPSRMRSQCPALYALLRLCYELDPADWNEA